MSVFGKIFGFRKDEKTVTASEGIQKLHETEEMLVKKQEYLESKINKELSIAKSNGTKNKRVAIEALRRKKRYETQLQQMDGTLSTIEMQREALEAANTNSAVFLAMSEAAKVLKAAHAGMDMDKLEEVLEDITEELNISRDISIALSEAMAPFNVDDDELERELEELEQAEMDAALVDVGHISRSPKKMPQEEKVFTTPKAGKNKHRQNMEDDEEEDVKRELEAWAS